MRKSIAFIVNHADREHSTYESISHCIQTIDSEFEIKLYDFRSADWVKNLILQEPSVILTFPFTAKGLSHPYYLFKYLFNTIIVTYRTEGIVNLENDAQKIWHIGLDSYDKGLVDYEVFWGRKTAESIGQILIENGRLTSSKQIKYFGHPSFEFYKNIQESDFESSLDHALLEKLRSYNKSKTTLFATDFRTAEYTEKDILNAGDWFDHDAPDAEAQLQLALSSVSEFKRYRNDWISMLANSAQRNPDVLHIIKSHPVENAILKRKNINPYEPLLCQPNILYIMERVHIGELLRFAGLFFHYGSTTNIEAYLCKVPSFYIDASQYRKNRYLDFRDIAHSQGTIQLKDIPELICHHSKEPIAFQSSKENEQFLRDFLSIDSLAEYNPSMRLAEFLIQCTGETPLCPAVSRKILSDTIVSMNTTLIDAYVASMHTAAAAEDFLTAVSVSKKLIKIVEVLNLQFEGLYYVHGSWLAELGLFKHARAALEKELSLYPGQELATEELRKLERIGC